MEVDIPLDWRERTRGPSGPLPGDVVEWDGEFYIVSTYTNRREGMGDQHLVVNLRNGRAIYRDMTHDGRENVVERTVLRFE